MANMSYCRFRNTLEDLYDCFENLYDDVSEEEEKARKKLVALCKMIADEAEDEFDD